jgi:mannosyltransferase
MQVDARRRTADRELTDDASSARLPVWALVLIGATIVAGIVLRFATRSDLWLDEALTVNIARLPLRDLPDALRHDGAPPLYYALLHVWMLVFGEGDVAVRAFAGVIGVATLPLAYFAGLRLGGTDPVRRRWVAWSAVILMVSSPFAIRYSTEARMYALVIALVLLGYLAVMRALEHASVGRLACVAAVTAALLYTHYWSFFLLAVVAAVLLRAAVGRSATRRASARRTLLAVGVGGACFLPWIPILLSQLEHTGTPWASPTISPSTIVSTFSQFAGGRPIVGRALLVVLGLLAVAGVLVRARVNRDADHDDDTDRDNAAVLSPVRSLALVGGATLLVGLGLSFVAGSTYQVRYAAVMFPFVVLVAAFGVTVLTDVRLRVAVLALAVVLGLVGAWRIIDTERTQAGQVATAIVKGAHRGDVIGYCPDQLGPSVSRLVPRSLGVRQYTFPTTSTPRRVDWVDYADKVDAADPAAFARMLLDRAGGGTVWFVSSAGYQPFALKCETIGAGLATDRGPGRSIVNPDANIFEHMGVLRFDP